MSRKGQSVIFENVLIFVAGVTIFILFYSVFTAYQANFTAIGIDSQLSEIRDYISTHILLMAGKEGINSSVIIKIPRTVATELYEVELYSGGLNLTSSVTSVRKHSNLYSLPVTLIPKRIPSSAGKITIYKKGNRINIM
ncbi:MAG: hypothetical protein V3V26_02540 [Candidatus Aenigmarchaeota archaeon]